jgi:tetraacyldisaccharide 4'-kinase
MDDGLFNNGLVKTVSIVVIDGQTGFGNKRLLPAGPLRLPLEDGMAMADAFIVIGGIAPHDILNTGKPVFYAVLETAWRPADCPYLAFTGLGRPEKFFGMLRDMGVNLVDARAYPDHHAYNAADLDALRESADMAGARLITTEKDAVRLPFDFDAEQVPVTLRFKDETALKNFLMPRLDAAHG